MQTLEQLITDDPLHLLGSAKDVSQRTGVKLETVEKFLDTNPIIKQVNEIHFAKKKNKQWNSITAPHIGWVQADLMDMTKIKKSPGNKHMGWALIIIDIFSRYSIVIPVKTKAASDVLVGIKRVFKDFQFTDILTDSGGEFKGVVHAFFEKNNIKHSTVIADEDHNKLGIVDRFTRTIRNTLRKLWELNDNWKWVPYIDKIVQNYNNRVHSTTKNKPIDIFEGRAENKQIISRDPSILKFSTGNKVRKRLKRGIFEKGGDRWSKRVYTIRGREGFKIILDDSSRNRPDDLLKTELENVDVGKSTKVKEKELTKKRQIKRELNRLDIDSKNIIHSSRKRA